MNLVFGNSYYIYILTNMGKAKLEIGLSGDLSVTLHQIESNGREEKNECCYLVYWERFADVADALGREKEISRLSKKKKEILITTTNPEWLFLNEAVKLNQAAFIAK